MSNSKTQTADILLAASRGTLERYNKEGTHHQFRMNGRKINRKPVLQLMSDGCLEVTGLGEPFQFFQRVSITIRGRAKLLELMVRG